MDWSIIPAAVTRSDPSLVGPIHMTRRIWHVTAVVGAMLAGTGCTAPSPRVVALAIVPATPTLIVGDAVDLRAVATRSDGSSVDVVAAWSVGGPGARVEDAAGRVRGLVAGESTIRAAAEGLSAETVVRIVPRLEGLWSGSFHLVQCQHISGGGPGLCKGWTSGTVGQLEWRFYHQVGPRFAVDVQSVSFGDYFGTLEGSVTPNGGLTLDDGELVSGTGPGNGVMRFLGFQGTVTSGALAAEATVERLFLNNWGPQHYRYPATFEARR